MAISQNFPNTRPSLNLNFARSQTLDPRITFARPSISGDVTYVDESGIIRYASADEPRFDFDPVTGECLGLLVEESRTNLLHYSTNFDNTYWLQTNITTNAVISPDGTTTAATYEGTGTGASSVYNVTNATVTASTQYTYSIYIKLGTMSASNYKFAVYDVSSGSFVGVDLVPSVTPTTTSWTRISYSFTTPSGCTAIRVYPFRNGSSITSSTVHFWGAQLEQGSFPTSYIPTSGSQGDRAADLVSITGTNFSSWYRQDEGTMFAEAEGSGPLITARATASAAYRIQLAIGISAVVVGGDPPQAGFGNTTALKRALAFKLNNTNAAFDGILGTNDDNCTIPSVDYATIGYFDFGGLGRINGRIKLLTFWPTRLPNETLQTITQ